MNGENKMNENNLPKEYYEGRIDELKKIIYLFTVVILGMFYIWNFQKDLELFSLPLFYVTQAMFMFLIVYAGFKSAMSSYRLMKIEKEHKLKLPLP